VAKFLILFFTTLITLIVWNASIFLAASEGWFKSPIVGKASATSFLDAVERTVAQTHIGNFAMILIEENEVAASYFMSSGAPVDKSSVFQVASLGKWLTSWGVMVLVEDGQISLDLPVSNYLKRWQLPPSEFDNSAITVRNLLSHTAGLDDGLGYDGFDKPEDVQTLEASLTRALDASSGNTGIVKLGGEPGSGWSYSGGGYTLLQLLIEDVSGMPFNDFMTTRIFEPLGMEQTTFDHKMAIENGLAENYDLAGQTEPFRWYTALAATSLFTSAEDLSTFITAQMETDGQSVLSDDALQLMRTPHASQMGADIWGLGLMLYAPNNEAGYIIGHDGNNGPAINTVARFDPANGNGIVILSTGSDSLATRMAGEWVFWKTGNIDSLMFIMAVERMLLWMAIGTGAILIGGLILGWRSRNARAGCARA
jgi:CubicO group peptidase (beta-lactamase class C family)